MERSLADVLTPCPSCKWEVPVVESVCPHCGAAADTTSSFLPFRRADNSKGMLDQLTAAYFRSRQPEPSQDDLDRLCSLTRRVELSELVFEDGRGTYRLQFEIHEASQLEEFREHLRICDSGGHLMSIPGFRLAFHDQSSLLAEIEFGFPPFILRWPGRWRNDACLLDAPGLAEYFKNIGFVTFRERLDQEIEREQQREVAHRAWLATWEQAVPPGMASLVEQLTEERYSPESNAKARAEAVLERAYPDVDDRVLALFAWYGHGQGPWSGYPAQEMAPEMLLEDYSAEVLVKALESRGLSRQQLEGASRFFARWVRKGERKKQRRLIDRVRASPVRQRLVEYSQTLGNDSKRLKVEKKLGK